MITRIRFIKFVISFALFFFMWILYGWNTYTLDYENYMLKFYDSDVFLNMGLIDIGYSYFNNFFYGMGFSFEEFRIAFSFICLFLLYRIVFTQSLAPLLVLFIYLFSVYSVDLVQMRNLLAYLLCFSFFPLLLNHTVKSKVVYALVVILCSTIHIGILFYLIFIFAKSNKYDTFLFHFVISLLSSFVIPGVLYSVVFMADLRINDYLFTYSYNSFIISIALIVFDIFVVRYFASRECVESLFVNEKNYGYFIYNCNLLLLYLIPLTFMNMTFIRLLRNFYLINIIFIVNKLCMLGPKRKVDDYILLCGFIGGAFYFFVWIKNVISPLFQNNSFF